MDRIRQYKRRAVIIGNVEARIVRAQEIENRRKQRRAEHVSYFRNNIIEKNDKNKSESKREVQEERMVRLQKWKIEQNQKKKLDAKNKQPVFRAGIPHKNLFSFTSTNLPIPHSHRQTASEYTQSQLTPKRVTRATIRRLAIKQTALLEKNENTGSNMSEPSEVSEIKEIRNKPVNMKIEPVVSNVPSHKFRKPSSVNVLPMFGHIWMPLSEKLDSKNTESSKLCKISPLQLDCENLDHHCISSTHLEISHEININRKNESPIKSNTEQNFTTIIDTAEGGSLRSKSCSLDPAEFSPYIVTSRGNRNARIEQQVRLGANNSLEGKIAVKDDIMQSLNISVGGEQKIAQYYKIRLKQQLERLTNLCTEWNKIQCEPETTIDGLHMINQAIGQTNLLIQKKFERFRGLISDCETGKTDMLVRCRDLQVSWDMILMGIKDCDFRFHKLTEMKAENWIDKNVQMIGVAGNRIINENEKIGKNNVGSFIRAAREKNLSLACKTETKGSEDNSMKYAFVTSKMKDSFITQPKTGLVHNIEKRLDTSFAEIKVNDTKKASEIELQSKVSRINSEFKQTPEIGIARKPEDFVLSTTLNANACMPKAEVISPISKVGCQSDEISYDSLLLPPRIGGVIRLANSSNVLLCNTSVSNTRVLRNREIVLDNLSIKDRRSIKKNNSFIVKPIEKGHSIAEENQLYTSNRGESIRKTVKFDFDEDGTRYRTKHVLPITFQLNRKSNFFVDTNCKESVCIPANGD